MAGPRTAAACLLVALIGCQPYTTRPAFGPLPGAADAVVDLDIPSATRLLAEALRADSIPVSRVEPADGYLETDWFDARTGGRATGRVLGDSVVRVRGWVNAYGKERGSVRLETAVRPMANPSLPARELDRQATPDNPAAVRVAKVLAELARRYPVPGAESPPPPSAKTDSGAKPAPRDSTAAPAAPKDSTIQKPFPKPPRVRPPGVK